MHSRFCDGKNTPEEMVLSAISKGLKTVGICAHAPMPFSADWCIKKEEISNFLQELERLKAKYKDKITVLCGLEDDCFAENVCEKFDYVIGSVHFFKAGDEYFSIDLSAKELRRAVFDGFGGDCIKAVRQYFENVVKVVAKGANIIGHFDLITKFIEVDPLFDLTDPEYINIWQSAVDKLIPLGIPFELNTGAISRGYRTTPYPSPEIIDYIKSKGGRFIISSDSHSAQNIAYEFDKWKNLLF